QPRDPNPPVCLTRLDRDETGRLQRTEQATHVSGVELQQSSQGPHVALFSPDLPQQPCLAEGAVSGQKPVVERPHTLGHDPVEPAHLGDHRLIHSLTIVREKTEVYPVRRPSKRIVQGSIVSIRRCVSLHGSRASLARIAFSDSASTACTTRSSSASGPPSTMKPSSTSRSMNVACAGQSDCSSI